MSDDEFRLNPVIGNSHLISYYIHGSRMYISHIKHTFRTLYVVLDIQWGKTSNLKVFCFLRWPKTRYGFQQIRQEIDTCYMFTAVWFLIWITSTFYYFSQTISHNFSSLISLSPLSLDTYVHSFSVDDNLASCLVDLFYFSFCRSIYVLLLFWNLISC